ncbi:hypothetical protein GPALN_012170 [Globodera pallida]|nr:hypothetical protein GPALN_012170 [Globodera pallida]
MTGLMKSPKGDPSFSTVLGEEKKEKEEVKIRMDEIIEGNEIESIEMESSEYVEVEDPNREEERSVEEDEPLKWERYVDDPNLEQEEAEEESEEEGMTADDQEERNANENGQRVRAKLDKSMTKYGLEESEEEEETTIAFVRGNENRENEREFEILGQNDIEREEEEFGTITEILLEGEAMTAYTAWPGSNNGEEESFWEMEITEEGGEIFEVQITPEIFITHKENDEVKKREQEESLEDKGTSAH